MRWISKVAIFIILLTFAGNAIALDYKAIFWHANSASDTILVERIATSIAEKLYERGILISPDSIRSICGESVFDATSNAREQFFQKFRTATRIDIMVRRFGGSVSATAYSTNLQTSDSLRIFYPGTTIEVSDWIEFQLTKWILPSYSVQTSNLKARLEVDGLPLGAEIYIDGKPTGSRIPARFDSIDAGIHLVEIVGKNVAASKVNCYPNTIAGVQLKGREVKALLEILTNPPGLNVAIDDVNSGATPYLRESPAGSYSITVGGGEHEELVRLVDIVEHEWRVINLTPRIMNRVVVVTTPPGAVLYNGPVRVGTSGDTLTCSPEGEDWTADHPYAYPAPIHVKGEPRKISFLEVRLPPAHSFLWLKNWYHLSHLTIDESEIAVTRPDSQSIPAGKHEVAILTPGFKTRKFPIDLQRGALESIEAQPIPSPSWKAAAMSLVVPGLGQFADGNRIRGAAFLVAAIISSSGWRQADRSLVDRINQAQSADRNYYKALSTSTAIQWHQIADSRWSSASQQSNKRNLWASSAIAIWGLAALDRIVFPTRELKPADFPAGSGIRVEFPIPGRKIK